MLSLALPVLCAGAPSFAAYLGPDAYTSFSQLTLARDTTKQYSIEVTDRLAEVTVLAPHGGGIESGTSQLAEELAGTDWNYYSFKGMMASGNGRLHLTSANYDDPIAVVLTTSSLIGVALHRQREETDTVCIGGLNKELRDAAAQYLQKAGFNCENPCKRLPGASCRSIHNRAVLGGLQLELSITLANELNSDAARRAKFTAALRQAIESLLPGLRLKAQERGGKSVCESKKETSRQSAVLEHN